MGTKQRVCNILIIDDNPDDVQLYERLLSHCPEVTFGIKHVELGEEGLEQYRQAQPECVLLDYNLPDMDGVEFMRRLTEQADLSCTPVVMLTGQGDEHVAVEAMKYGASDYLVKGEITRERLSRVIYHAIERAQTAKDIKRLILGVESAGEAIMMTDVDGTINFVNPAFTQLTGYFTEEVIGQNPRILQSKEHSIELYKEMWSTILSGQSWKGQIINRRKDGTLYDAQLTIAPVKDDHGRIQGFVSVHNDITPLKKTQKALEAANAALEKKNKILTELTETAHRFVDNVAHDFRTPLTVIKEFSSIIADGLGGPVTEQQNEYLQFIITATRDLAQMVDDFLDSSKLKARVLRVNREPCGVEQIFESVRSIIKARAAIKKIRVFEEIQTDLPNVFGDAEKIERVIINLVINAIKFSNEGSQITLWAKATDEGDVEIGITDQGPGLSQDDLEVIFERFKQVGDIQRASTKGFGLGLNIAKELVWLNLGTVYVKSQQGQGSTFSFTLPVYQRPIILRRYFERFEELSELPQNMAILQVKPDEPTADLQEVRRFLTSECFPMDLVLIADDQRAVYVFGSSSQPKLWVEKLQKARMAQIQDRPKDQLPALHIYCLASGPYAKMKESASSSSLSEITGLRHCA